MQGLTFRLHETEGDHMAWTKQPAADWDEWVSDTSDQLGNAAVNDAVERFDLLPALPDEVLTGAVHEGPLKVAGDFTQPELVTAIDGDLTVDGRLSTQGVAGYDGNATLVVFGDLRCRALVNDWASVIIVTGDCHVADWCFAAREDSSFVVGGDFNTPVFVGSDIWVSVGGTASMGAGLGYALGLDDAGPPVRPAADWRGLRDRLKLPPDVTEKNLVQYLEARLFKTGGLLP